MLLQPADDALGSALLLPAWPCEWDVHFKLQAPRQTTVVGSLVAGKLEYHVEPAGRARFISAAGCQ